VPFNFYYVTENHGVGGSIPPLGTTPLRTGINIFALGRFNGALKSWLGGTYRRE
jgi:hypothetical protein